jgi:hypothetical protein
LLRPPRRISTVFVRPTEGSAPSTTATIASAMSALSATDRFRGRAAATARAPSQTSQQRPTVAGSARSPK